VFCRVLTWPKPMTPNLLASRPPAPAAVCPETEGALKLTFDRLPYHLKQQYNNNAATNRTFLVRSQRPSRLHLFPPRSSESPIHHNIPTSAFARRISISIRTQCTPPSLNTYHIHLHLSSPPANCSSIPLTPSIHDGLTAAKQAGWRHTSTASLTTSGSDEQLARQPRLTLLTLLQHPTPS
jgi:hypothetical protein